nr:tryptophan 7-halogenase [uncultured Pseudomonas sp.]
MLADVLILGAGPAGAIAALNLAAHCRVLLLDRLPEPAQRIGESLPPAARRLLTDMDLWQEFVAQGHAPCYGNRSIWNGELAEQDFLRDPDGHGWHLDRARFETWLRAKALARGAALLAPATLLSVARIEGGWQLLVQTANGPIQLQARLLIDAGGRASVLSKKLGARRKRQDKLVCAWLYGHDHGKAPSDGLSHIEAVEHGWWYSAALPGKRRVLALHTDADLPPARNFKIDGWLAGAAWQAPGLAALLDSSGFIAEGPVQVAAAHSSELQPAGGDDWLAVGDAALSFDPLSSQGLFNALYTGLAAAEAGYRHLRGETTAIADYRRQLADIARAYRDHLRLYYREESRWADAPFWQRRQAASAR